MAVENTYSIFDKDGNPTILGPGTYFCFGCSKLRKVINYPFTGTIDKPCTCKSKIVFTM